EVQFLAAEFVLAGVDACVELRNSCFQYGRIHFAPLIRTGDIVGQLLERIAFEEPAREIDVRRLGLPALAIGSRLVEHRPDRSAAVELAGIAAPRKARGEEVVIALRLVDKAQTVFL